MATPINNSVPKINGLINPVSQKFGNKFAMSAPNLTSVSNPIDPKVQQTSLENSQNKTSTVGIAPTYSQNRNSVGIPTGSYTPTQNTPQLGSQATPPTPQPTAPQTGYQATNTPITPPLNPTGANTYSGGVNLYGQTLPGYTPQPQSQPQSLYGGLVSRVAEQSAKPSEQFINAQNSALGYQEKLRQLQEEQATGIKNIQNSGTPLSQALGEAGAINQLYASRENALAGAFQGASSLLPSATSQQQAQISGTTAAAGLAAPTQVPYSNQYIDPTTGQPIAGGGGTGALGQLPPQAQSAIQSYAEQVRNGSMTRQDAESRLGAYGVAGTNALNEVLGTGFNTNASNASASTTAQGQQLQTAAHATTQALDSLQSLFNQLPGIQTGGIPLTNKVANLIAGALGSPALTQYNQTLHDARAQLQGVLTASGGATPTGAEAMALTYLPDNMTAGQLSAAISNVKNLVQQKVGSFTQSGQQNQNNSSGGSSGGVINTPYGAINPNL